MSDADGCREGGGGDRGGSASEEVSLRPSGSQSEDGGKALLVQELTGSAALEELVEEGRPQASEETWVGFQV